jgi:bifunctional DNase/RNase
MVEDDFSKHKLPEDFPEKVVQEVVIKAVRMADTKGSNLFSIGLQNQNDLDSGKIPAELIDRLKDIQIPLSDNAVVAIQRPSDEWIIKDNEITFSIQKEGDRLNVYKSMISQVPVVLLQNKADDKQIMPIYIGFFEAIAIIQQLEGKQLPRPMTHDLTLNILKEFDMKIVKVVVTDLRQDTFYAKITVESDGKIKEIDARPSDSIALALRAEAPIFVAKSVLGDSATTDDIEKFKPFGNIISFGKLTVK